MDIISNNKIRRNEITKRYRIAVYSYLVPFMFLVLSVIDSATLALIPLHLFATFLFCLLPSGVIGLIFTIKGLALSFKNNDYPKKDIGYANLVMGVIIVLGGLIGISLGYLMVS